MTESEKAKAYDEALKKAKGIINYYKEHNRDEAAIEDLETIFPELKESEDEKIRKALVKFHKSTIDIDGIKGADILAWLEKQGESYTKKDVDDAYLKGICDAKHELEKQGTPVKLDEKEIQTAKDKMFPYQENVGRSYEQAWAASGFELEAHFVLNRLKNNGYFDEIYKQGE